MLGTMSKCPWLAIVLLHHRIFFYVSLPACPSVLDIKKQSASVGVRQQISARMLVGKKQEARFSASQVIARGGQVQQHASAVDVIRFVSCRLARSKFKV